MASRRVGGDDGLVRAGVRRRERGLLVPGVLLWIAFDTQGVPIVTVLKWLAVGLMGVSAVHTFATRER